MPLTKGTRGGTLVLKDSVTGATCPAVGLLGEDGGAAGTAESPLHTQLVDGDGDALGASGNPLSVAVVSTADLPAFSTGDPGKVELVSSGAVIGTVGNPMNVAVQSTADLPAFSHADPGRVELSSGGAAIGTPGSPLHAQLVDAAGADFGTSAAPMRTTEPELSLTDFAPAALLGSQGVGAGTTSLIGNYSSSNLGVYALVPTGKKWRKLLLKLRICVSSGTFGLVGGFGNSASGLANGLLLRVVTGITEADGTGGVLVRNLVYGAITGNHGFMSSAIATLQGLGTTRIDITHAFPPNLVLTAGQAIQLLARDNHSSGFGLAELGATLAYEEINA